MGKVTINYSDINDSAKRAKNVADYYEDYANDLQNKVRNKLNNLQGSDSRGNISEAMGTINNKINEFRNKKNTFSLLSTNLYKLKDNVEKHENNVVTKVRSIAENAFDLKNQGKWKAFTQWLYGAVCVDLVNWNPITRGYANLYKKTFDWIDNKGSKVVDWFKHGNGKYVLNIIKAAIGDILAVIGTISAIMLCVAATVATGGIAAPLLVAAIASTIGTVMTLVDSGFSIYNNIKALKISRDEEDPGRARFYGGIGGLSDSLEKHDYGDSKQNKTAQNWGKAYDATHTVANITATVAGQYGQAGLTENLARNPDGSIKTTMYKDGVYHGNRSYTYDKNVARENFKGMWKENLGYKNNNGKWTWSFKNLINPNKSKTGYNYRSSLYTKHMTKDVWGKGYSTVNKVKDYVSVPKNVIKHAENVDKIIDRNTGGWDRTKTILDETTTIPGIKDMKIAKDYKTISGDIKDVKSIISDVKDIVTPSPSGTDTISSIGNTVSGAASGLSQNTSFTATTSTIQNITGGGLPISGNPNISGSGIPISPNISGSPILPSYGSTTYPPGVVPICQPISASHNNAFQTIRTQIDISNRIKGMDNIITINSAIGY